MLCTLYSVLSLSPRWALLRSFPELLLLGRAECAQLNADAVEKQDLAYLKSVASFYEVKTSNVMMGCVGCLDGLMIKICKPTHDSVKSWCRKGVSALTQNV